MQYLRLFSVVFLLSIVITGCHRRREAAAPPPQAQAPIVTTLPPVPPLTFPNVELPKPKPTTATAKPAPPPKPKPQPVKKVHHRYFRHKTAPEKSAATTANPAATGSEEAAHPASGGEGGQSASGTSAAPATTGTAALGKLSADDATTDPSENVKTQRLIQRTEARLKRLSKSQQARHKDAVAQIASFLSQAKQAWEMNDMIGAETLANKAKILLDELVTNTLPMP